MSEISRVALFGKLNPVAYKAIEGATVFCKLRGNPYVELVHWLTQLLETQDSDVQAIVRHYGIDQAALARDVTATLDRLPRGFVGAGNQVLIERVTVAGCERLHRIASPLVVDAELVLIEHVGLNQCGRLRSKHD